ncbi:MAG TPA: TRL-like family protein [Myxococcota bacterium]|nr:TRL-like family protein [Myxococcota bacterium]
MPRSALLVVAVTLALVGSIGCAGVYSSPVMPAQAFLFNNIKAPMDIDFNKTQVPSKRGEASTSNILGLFAWGDCSTEAAARNGNIKEIESADYEFLNVLGVYSTYTTIVHGN